MRKRQNKNNDDRGIIDLTQVGSSFTGKQKRRKMRPPNMSSRLDYSYEDQIDSNASIQLLGDSADNDAANTLNVSRNEPEDIEGELVSDIQVADRIGISSKGQGFSGFVEETYYPASNKVTSKKLI